MIDPKTLLSDHMSVATFTKSSSAIRHGVDNGLPEDQLERAESYCVNFFEKMRLILGDQPVNINSGWRCKALNDVLPGSSKTSDHMKANAIDFDCNNRMTLPEVFKILVQSDLRYKQLMIEGVTKANPQGGWIHGAYDTDVTDELQKMEIKIVTFAQDENGVMQPRYLMVKPDAAVAWCAGLDDNDPNH